MLKSPQKATMSVVLIFNLSRDSGRQVFLSPPPLSSKTLLYCFRADPLKITIYLQLTTCIICGHLINSFGAVLDIWSSFLSCLQISSSLPFASCAWWCCFTQLGNVKSSLRNSSPCFTILTCVRIVRQKR